jgi:2-polyprenyl-3-methyl-5-hydroxy-6-metoxy-1,4-benzoquinol methylase
MTLDTAKPTDARLTQRASHFNFGRNWANFARSLDEERIALAVASLERLLPRDLLAGASMLDIGSGSGLSSLAALRLGARRVVAIDLDEEAVETSRAVLARFAPQAGWEVRRASVFDLADGTWPQFDLVHSWGVLHHTGDLSRAIELAAGRVAPKGTLALALYRRTPIDRFWIAEKRFYTAAPPFIQATMRGLFKAGYLAGLVATGRNPVRYVRDYGAARGMRWSNDVHDWLGGYPYEAVDAAEVTRTVDRLGFSANLVIERPLPAFGLFGAPCNEYRFKRRT